MVTCGDRTFPAEGISTDAVMCPCAQHLRGLEEASDGGEADRGAMGELESEGAENQTVEGF